MVEKFPEQSADKEQRIREFLIGKGEEILTHYGFADRVDEMVTRNGRTVRAGDFLTIDHCLPALGTYLEINRLSEEDPERQRLESGMKKFIGIFFEGNEENK